MEILYTTHHNLVNLHAMAPALSIAIVAGSLYGCVRAVLDAIGWVSRNARWPTES